MVAALYSSRCAGPNHFIKEGVTFGWESIEQMLHREVLRKKSGQLPRVPGLKESYVYRDSWTRLNVKPAKIMQVALIMLYIHMFPCSSKNMLYQN